MIAKDQQTVTPAGARVAPQIDGVVLRSLVTQADERGTLTEIYDLRWNLLSDPLVYVYEFTIRPGYAKGWIMHRLQTDRLMLLRGAVRVVLYDGREQSPTFGLINQITVTEYNRMVICYPAGVWHALQNVGTSDSVLINMPTQPYQHEDPDKYRLPLSNDLIPFRFEGVNGW